MRESGRKDGRQAYGAQCNEIRVYKEDHGFNEVMIFKGNGNTRHVETSDSS